MHAKPHIKAAFDYLKNLRPVELPPFAALPLYEPEGAKPGGLWHGACTPPNTRIPPEFRLHFDRIVVLERLSDPGEAPTGPRPPLHLEDSGPVPDDDENDADRDNDEAEAETSTPGWAPEVDGELAVILRFDQVWTLHELCIGDLDTTFGLAPGEELRLEVVTSQRRLLEQKTLDQREEMTSSENTTLDKEVVNVTSSSSKTRKWGVNGNAGLSLGKIFTLGLKANYSKTIQDTSKSSREQIREATSKSAESLKLLQKVEVREVTEEKVENRSVRTIRNPLPDRSMTVNMFSLVKRFDVSTGLASRRSSDGNWAVTGLRPAIVFDLSRIPFDASFVRENATFLREELLDPVLAEAVPLAVEGAQPRQRRGPVSQARQAGGHAMALLFHGDTNVFNRGDDSNDWDNVTRAYDAQELVASLESGRTGLSTAAESDQIPLFTAINVFYWLYWQMDRRERRDKAADLAVALHDGIADEWQQLTGSEDDSVKRIVVLEPIARLSGFMVFVEGYVKPALEAERVEAEAYVAGREAYRRLKAHLEYYREHYVRRFLAYLSEATHGAAFDAVVQSALEEFRQQQEDDGFVDDLLTALDLGHMYFDGSQLVIPSTRDVTDNELNDLIGRLTGEKGTFDRSDIEPFTDTIDVPADGVHLEAVAGTCTALTETDAVDFDDGGGLELEQGGGEDTFGGSSSTAFASQPAGFPTPQQRAAPAGGTVPPPPPPLVR